MKEIEVVGGWQESELKRSAKRLFVGAISFDSDSPVCGAVDSAVLGKDAQGNWELRVYGWLTGVQERPVLLQLAVPGSPFVLPQRMERPDVAEQLRLPDAINSGFLAYIPLRTKISGEVEVHFLVTLDDGLTLAGVLLAVVKEQRAGGGPATELGQAGPGSDDYARLIAVRDRNLRTELASFLRCGGVLDFSRTESALVSVIVPVFNRAELTLACLRSLAAAQRRDLQVVVVDNHSTDETKALLARIRGATIIENDTNRHYLEACNQGAARAEGRHLLFLNNDATVLPETISAALAAFDRPAVAAVGARVIRPDGTLQEAGSIVWNDASTMGYGVGEDPGRWEYLYRRDVDYCSGVFLLTTRNVFEELGGFDAVYRPAYYEDADYCLRLKERGYRVIYEPGAIVFHAEHSSSDLVNARTMQLRNRGAFLQRHRQYIERRPAYSPDALAACVSGPSGSRILLLEDQIPAACKGSGFPRTAAMVRALHQLGAQITFLPALPMGETFSDVYQVLPPEVEVAPGWGRERLADFLAARRGCYDYLLVCRPHNMSCVDSIRRSSPELLEGVKVVFDAEALSALREIRDHEVKDGMVFTQQEIDFVLQPELELTRSADIVLSASEMEADVLRKAGCPRIEVISHAIAADPTPNDFAARSGMLSVGPIYDGTTPNADGTAWFVANVLPWLAGMLGESVQFRHAGYVNYSELQQRCGPSFELLGPVDDLSPLYNSARLFVAPTRFSAGIPLKVIEAAAHGLPVVATAALVRQLGWEAGREILVADSEREFAAQCAALYSSKVLWNTIRENALKRVAGYSPAAAEERLRKIFTAPCRDC